MVITKERVFKDFEKLKQFSYEAYKNDKLSMSIEYAKNAARLMYNFNFIYTDDKLEELIVLLSKKIFVNQESIVETYEKRIVFYDYFSLDNRGLSEQYIKALVDLDFEILYITLQKDETKMANIKLLLEKNKKNEIYLVHSKQNIEKIEEIREKIYNYKPRIIFNHTAPEDICGMVALENIGKNTERYLINLTDHAFWLGKSCSDYFIEFRSYGKNISKYYRKIDEKKSIILPYYPIQNENIEYKGLPFDFKNKKMIFSGGSLYKIYGSPVFFLLVKYILNKYNDSIFLYLGNGDTRPLLNFIKENKYEDRFFFLKERKDIDKIFKKCYFYLGTYPIVGGLMSQFAVMNKKIPVCYFDKEIPCNKIEELFINNENLKLTFSDLDEVKNEIDKLFVSKEYMEEKVKKICNIVITPSKFKEELNRLLTTKNTSFIYKDYLIDIDKFSAIYLEQENKYLKQYLNMFSSGVLKRKFYFYYMVKKLKNIIKNFRN